MKSLEFVKSHYSRSVWSGLVLVRKKRKGIGDLLAILILRDRRGNPVSRRMVRVLDEAWTRPTEAIDIKEVNPAWLDTSKLPEGLKEQLDYEPLGGYTRRR